MAPLNQLFLQKTSDDYIDAAQTLLQAQQWNIAYHLAGLAVELALKSCVLSRMVETGVVFENKKIGEECLTHDLNKLVDLAGLKTILENERTKNGNFAANWGTTSNWTVTSRYETKSQAEAEALISAITDSTNGVMQWVRKYW